MVKIILTNTENIPNKEYEILGPVSGSIVKAKNIGRDIMAGFKNLVGGEIKSYTEMLSEAREEALSRLMAEAEKLGADAVVSIRYSSSAIMEGASEILAYGTAVKFKEKKD